MNHCNVMYHIAIYMHTYILLISYDSLSKWTTSCYVLLHCIMFIKSQIHSPNLICYASFINHHVFLTGCLPVVRLPTENDT